jgi:hypothetical protein
MRLKDWLNEQYNGCIRVQRLAELVEVNGSFYVHGWGYIRGGGIYGRHGLEQDEALELLYMSGTTRGFILSGDSEDELYDAVRAEIERVRQMREQTTEVA